MIKLIITTTLLLSSVMLISPAPVFAAGATTIAAQQNKKAVYTCPMDSDVKASKPGKCPKCGMALRKADVETPTAPVAGTEGAGGQAAGSQAPQQIPDTTVYDQNGRKLRFYTDLVKGKTVAINFIFTTCTTICPPLTATFRKVQQELSNRVGRDVELISVSVDPTIDVPERLNSFAAKFKVQPGWTFVTGSKPDIDQLLRALGAFVTNKNDHTPMILVGNEGAGYWTRTYGLATPAALVKVITEAADKGASRPAQSEEASSAQVPMPGANQSLKASERQVERRVAANPVATGEPEKKTAPAETAAAYFPNRELITQDNKPVRFFDDLLKGKTVMINFVFTTCTGVCPPMTANLSKVQEFLGDRVGRDINMITISVDPLVDTPQVLKKYAATFKAKPGWHFLTGKKEDVDKVLQKLGGYVDDKLKHSSVLLVGNLETGEWVKMAAMAKPDQIAEAVRKIAGSK